MPDGCRGLEGGGDSGPPGGCFGTKTGCKDVLSLDTPPCSVILESGELSSTERFLKDMIVNEGTHKTHVVLGDEPPRYINGFAVAMSQTANSKTISINPYTNYPDPRDSDPGSVIRRYYGPIMMEEDTARALVKFLTRMIDADPAENENGDPS